MSTSPPILGLDIGGANLKAATSDRRAASRPFPLWKHPDRLPLALTELVGPFADCDEIAVTMTGELCDCFETKREGVHAIVRAVRNVSRSRAIHVWSTDGRFLNSQEAIEQPIKVASANWHALATFAGSYVPRGTAVLVDVGTTTTDIIPLVDGVPVSQGRTDTDRLMVRELVYTGWKRTPVCAILGFDAAAELFATTYDVYLRLGLVAEEPTDTDTADGRPATVRHAHARLSRMLCGDPEVTPEEVTRSLAEGAMAQQSGQINQAFRVIEDRIRDRSAGGLRESAARLLGQVGIPSAAYPSGLKVDTVIFSGSGEFLARRSLDALLATDRWPSGREAISLSDRLGPELSACAPAYAVAVLARERRG